MPIIYWMTIIYWNSYWYLYWFIVNDNHIELMRYNLVAIGIYIEGMLLEWDTCLAFVFLAISLPSKLIGLGYCQMLFSSLPNELYYNENAIYCPKCYICYILSNAIYYNELFSRWLQWVCCMLHTTSQAPCHVMSLLSIAVPISCWNFLHTTSIM